MKEILQLAADIRLLILDVDGVLTDGRIYTMFDSHGEYVEIKVFHARDGHGVKLLRQAGVEVAVISGRSSPLVVERMRRLGVERIVQGCDDKAVAWQQLREELGISNKQTAYLGDDTIDLPVMSQVGLPAAVADAHPEVLGCARWVSRHGGGQGAVREFCDLLIAARN